MFFSQKRIFVDFQWFTDLFWKTCHKEERFLLEPNCTPLIVLRGSTVFKLLIIKAQKKLPAKSCSDNAGRRMLMTFDFGCIGESTEGSSPGPDEPFSRIPMHASSSLFNSIAATRRRFGLFQNHNNKYKNCAKVPAFVKKSSIFLIKTHFLEEKCSKWVRNGIFQSKNLVMSFLFCNFAAFYACARVARVCADILM